MSATACTTPAQPPFPGSPAQAINVGDTKLAATAYYQSGAYDTDLSIVTSRAGAWMAERIPQVRRPAVVFDIDDTSLSNWEVIKANDFGRVFKGPCRSLPDGPCGWVAWDLLGRSPAIPQSLAIFRILCPSFLREPPSSLDEPARTISVQLKRPDIFREGISSRLPSFVTHAT